MSMNKVPSLIIGIGGIGCRIAAGISDMLSDADREYVGIVGMDTNVNDLKKMDDHSVKTIQTSDERKVIDFLREEPEYLAWFPVERFTINQGMLNGAAQIRAISRLAGIAAEERGNFSPIKEEISRIRYHHDKFSNNLTVMIVGSITGGTGAGLFLQLPFYIRKLIKDDTGLENVVIRGMFVGPDLTVDVQPSDINKEAVRVNAYSCLKELNALYLTQTRDNNNLEIDYYDHRDIREQHIREEEIRDKLSSYGENEYEDELNSFLDEIHEEDTKLTAENSANIPYDYLYMIEGSTGQSSTGNAQLEEIEQQVSKMVFTLLFTPVMDNALSVEDNMVLHDMKNNGMGRYSSAGLHRLVYPNDLAKEYVTLAVTRDLVKEEWLLLEKMHDDEVRDARDRQRTDAMVEIPRLQDTYVKNFADLTETGELGKFNHEAYVTNNKERISRAVSFIKKITDMVEEVKKSSKIELAKNACNISANAFDGYDTAASQVGRVYDAIEEYIKVAKNVVISESSAIANKLFPTSLQSLQTLIKSNDESCIYQWLHGVHPITARFLIYDMMNRCEKKIEFFEKDMTKIDLQAYENDNYSDKPVDNQKSSPMAAIHQMKDKTKNATKGLRKIRSLFTTNIERETNQISSYITDGLSLAVFKSVLQRLKMLAENYRIFFQSIDDVVKESKKTIDRIEAQQMPLGQTGVYCSKEALQYMAEEYKQSSDSDLPEATKEAVFNSLFKVYAKDYDERNRVRTERQKEIYAAQRRVELANVFQKAIIDTIRTNITKNDNGIVNMNIHQALCKEMELKKNIVKDFDDDYDAVAAQYIKEKIEGALLNSAPMLAVDTASMAHNTETVYLAMNPDFAEFRDGKPDAAATADLYLPQRSVETDYAKASVLIDEEFSPYELICFKARYKFTIEELVKYRKGTPNERAYKKRIMSLGTKPDTSLGEESGKTVVNPHLNRYWHEEGFLPEISAADRKLAHRDLLRVFVYSMGMDRFVLHKNDDVMDRNGNATEVWEFNTGRGNIIVKSRGRIIGNTYTDLFRALPFNGWIKRRMLSLADAKKRETRRYKDVDDLFATIMKDDFIVDLIQPKDSKEASDINILDLFLKMRDYMEPDEWCELFDGLIDTLWDYLSFLFDKNVRYVNHATRDILNSIIENSSIGDKPEDTYSTKERRAKEQMNAILEKQYKK